MSKFRLFALLLAVSFLIGCQSAQEKYTAVLYQSWDDNGRVQLYHIEHGQEPVQLTQSEQDILDFAPAPDGSQIVYTTGSEMWRIDQIDSPPQQILTCSPDQCNQIVWHPDSQQLLYERMNPNGPTTLWWLDSETGETIPLHQETDKLSQAAQFSGDGEWVSYVLPATQELEFFNFENGRRFQLPSSLGTPAVWHPTESKFLYNNQQLITFHGDTEEDDHQGHNHEFTYSLPLLLATTEDEGQSAALVSEMEITDDASPAWSPDGEWIVFGRKLPGVENGRQLWLIRPDGSQAQALTDSPLIHHGVPQWSSDGRTILYQRFDTQTPSAKPSIWLIKSATGEKVKIAAIGFDPQWLP